MKDVPNFSIVVASYEKPIDVGKLLQSITGQLKGDKIIVVDDGSSLFTQKVLKREVGNNGGQNTTLIFEKHGGVSSARNRGIQEAQKDNETSHVILVDQDAIAKKNWLEEMRKTANTADGVQGNIWEQVVTTDIDRIHRDYRRSVSKALRDTPGGNYGVNTRNFAVDKRYLSELGDEPFIVNEKAHGGEDSQFGLRLLETGAKIEVNDEAIVYHTGDPNTLRGLMDQKRGHARSNGIRGVLPNDVFGRGNYRRAVAVPVIAAPPICNGSLVVIC